MIDESIKEILDKLDLTPEEIAEASNIFLNETFKNVMNQIIQIKRNAIADEVETQSELDKARMTIIGNKEILNIFECLHTKYEEERPRKEEVNEHQILPET